MQLFDSVKLYVFAFALSAFIAVEKLRHLAKGSLSEPGGRIDTMSLLLTLVTVCIAVYLAGLLRKLSSRTWSDNGACRNSHIPSGEASGTNSSGRVAKV
jgi:hypothetical protein